MNILLIGSAGILSAKVFHHLLASEHVLSAVAVYKRRYSELNPPIATVSDDIELLALQTGIRIIELSDVETAQRQITELAIDVSVMSCYAKRLPQEIIEITKLGCFNIHPSLLPDYRGPEPLFWQFKQSAEFGVSIHRVSERFDAGAIVKQAMVQLTDGSDYATANTEIVSAALPLLDELLEAIPLNDIVYRAQDETKASYYPYPMISDFDIDTRLPAQQIYNFVCGTRYFCNSYQVDSGDDSFAIADVISYTRAARSANELELAEGQVAIQCSPGTLIARLT